MIEQEKIDELFEKLDNIIIEGKKKFSRCKKLLDKSNFSKDRRSKDGLDSSCKECYKKVYQKNKQRISSIQKKYYEKNKEKIKNRVNKYRCLNQEKIDEKKRRYHKKLRENIDDKYIKVLIYNQYKIKYPQQEFIELKRAGIEMKRKIKEVSDNE